MAGKCNFVLKNYWFGFPKFSWAPFSKYVKVRISIRLHVQEKSRKWRRVITSLSAFSENFCTKVQKICQVLFLQMKAIDTIRYQLCVDLRFARHVNRHRFYFISRSNL